MAGKTLLVQARERLVGEKKSAVLARQIMPRLVRQAGGAGPITYGELAAELDRHHRGMDWALGRIGQAIDLLSRSWRATIPPLEALVVFAGDGHPRDGVNPFLQSYFDISDEQLAARRSDYCKMAIEAIRSYRDWPAVLQALGLPPIASEEGSPDGRNGTTRELTGGGEGPEHKALRLWLQDHPEAIGLTGWPRGQTEVLLPSGDRVDVVFRRGDHVYAVEVKSRISTDDDLARGLYQCVKYRSIMALEAAFKGRTDTVMSLLVLSRSFPSALVALENHLAVEHQFVPQPSS